jgi:serine protease Do
MPRKFSMLTVALTAVMFLFGGMLVASQLNYTPETSAQRHAPAMAPIPASAKAAAGAKLANQNNANPNGPNANDTTLRVEPNGTVQVPNFASLAKQLMPGVVNISTTKVVRSPFFRGAPPMPHGPGGSQAPGRGRSQAPRGGDQFEDFFNRFFQGQPREFKQTSLGSGFIIEKNGYILTNFHVVAAADEIIVTLSDESEHRARVVGRDEKTDIALIKIDAGAALPVLPLGDSDNLAIGEWILAIGNPFGLSHTVTAGIVSAKGRVIGAGPYDDFIQVDASINPGNSGGPLINTRGEVVGINTAIFSQTGQSAGIGFAIPVNLAKNIARQLQDEGRVTRGWLGVMIQRIDPDLQQSYGLPSADGALISKVVDSGPAAKAGLRQGDIVLAFNDKPVRHHSDLPAMVANSQPGDQATLEILREGRRQKVRVQVEEMADQHPERAQSRAPVESESRLGLQLQELTPELRQRLGATSGIVVAAVEPGSTAELKGMQSGDILLELNGNKVSDVKKFVETVHSAKSGTVLRLLVRRADSQYFVALPKP